MDYPFEELGPDRFQALVQSLIVKQNPNAVCFPIGQADGGRDAVVPLNERSSPRTAEHRQIVLFQVKYSRSLHQRGDPVTWLVQAIKNEAHKISKLQDRGITIAKYIIVTNLEGTGPLDVGTIDRLASTLRTSALPGPAIAVWWRTDVSRRLDGAASIRARYPEVLSAVDVLLQLQQPSEDARRRAETLTSYLRHEYHRESELKFKEAGLLSNKLLRLFVDVPTVETGAASDEWELPYSVLRRERLPRLPNGAVQLLTSALDGPERIVLLEGAPGQGKSTVTQFLCQLYRARILRRTADFAQTGHEYPRTSAIRIPFRIELRNFARWLVQEESEDPSLERYLATQVHTRSGGLRFDATDFVMLARESLCVVMLDGLDEVADLSQRERVLGKVRQAWIRLGGKAGHTAFVITSRPSAFSDSPKLPADTIASFALVDLDDDTVLRYAKKWSQARRLSDDEQQRVVTTLQSGLQLDHIRELGTNPMQLAILLSVIYTRSSSLPQQRSHLYKEYVRQFLDREAEKSTIVREYRVAYLDIHSIVAWRLHTEAESSFGAGLISDTDLRQIIDQYCSNAKIHGVDSDLFLRGMVDRLVMLVSRVEGTFEFEVQPLREYFAAVYLKDTIPYSRAGDPALPGTLPERILAMTKRPYWMNVTRFLAGLLSREELYAVVDAFEELLSDNDWSAASSVRNAISGLLGDGVFRHNSRAMEKMMTMLINAPGAGPAVWFSTIGSTWAPTYPPHVQSAIVEYLATALDECSSREELAGIAGVAVANTSVQERLGLLSSVAGKASSWKRRATLFELQVAANSAATEVRHLATTSKVSEATAACIWLSASNKGLRAVSGLVDEQRLLREAVSGHYDPYRTMGELAFISAVCSVYWPSLVFSSYSHPSNSVLALLPRMFRWETGTLGNVDEWSSTGTRILELFKQPVGEWRASAMLWDALVSLMIASSAPGHLISAICINACHAKARAGDNPSSTPLIDTIAERKRSGSVKFWRTRLLAAEPELRSVATFTRWASAKCLFQLQAEFSECLNALSADRWAEFASVVALTPHLPDGGSRSLRGQDLSRLDLNERALFSLSQVGNKHVRDVIHSGDTGLATSDDACVRRSWANHFVIGRRRFNTATWSLLSESLAHSSDPFHPCTTTPSWLVRRALEAPPLGSARRILEAYQRYPGSLLAVAADGILQRRAREAPTVLEASGEWVFAQRE